MGKSGILACAEGAIFEEKVEMNPKKAFCLFHKKVHLQKI